MWHQAGCWMWGSHVVCRGSGSLYHLSTSAHNVLFMLFQPPLPHPSKTSKCTLSSHLLLCISLIYVFIQDLNYTPECIFLFLSSIYWPAPSHLPPLLCSVGVRKVHLTLNKSLLSQDVLRRAEEWISTLNLSWQSKVPNDWPRHKITATSPAAALRSSH